MSYPNPVQPLDPTAPPPVITPADTPSSPSGYAAVTPHGQGTAWYDVQAPQQDLTASVETAGRLTGAGVVYPRGPRQAETEALLQSPMGFGEFDVTAGYHGAPGQDGWPANTEPGG